MKNLILAFAVFAAGVALADWTYNDLMVDVGESRTIDAANPFNDLVAHLTVNGTLTIDGVKLTNGVPKEVGTLRFATVGVTLAALFVEDGAQAVVDGVKVSLTGAKTGDGTVVCRNGGQFVTVIDGVAYPKFVTTVEGELNLADATDETRACTLVRPDGSRQEVVLGPREITLKAL